ncbi:hypothetical protein GGF31_008426 [Allomyces arbusculus]|nr:hypothetical protein GGF31_008426 [Allomyces arbusculus]
MTGASCRLPNSRTTSTVVSSTDSTGISGILALARIVPPPRRLANIAPRPALTLVPPLPDADTVIDHRLSRNGGATSIPSTPRIPLLDSSRDPGAATRTRAPPPAALQIPYPSPAYGGHAVASYNSPVSAGISSSHETLRNEPASSPAAFLPKDPVPFLHQDPAPFLCPARTTTAAGDADDHDDDRTTRLTLRFSTITSLFSKPPPAPKPGRATHVVSFPLPSTLASTVPTSLAPYYSPTTYAAHLAALQHEHAAFARQLRTFHLLSSFFLALFSVSLLLLAIPSIRHRHIQLLAVALATSVVMGAAASVSARAARAQILRAMAAYADKNASIPDARVHWAVRHAPVGSNVQVVITAPDVLVSVRDRVVVPPPVEALPVAIPTPPPVTPPPTPSPARPAPAALQDHVPGVAHLAQMSRRPSPIAPTAGPPFLSAMPATPPPTPVHATPAALQAQAPVAPDVSHLVQTSRRPSAPSPLLFGASVVPGPDRRPSTPSPLFGAGPRFADRRPSEATAARIAAGLGMRADSSAGARSAPPDLMMTGAAPTRAPVVHLHPWGSAAPAALPVADDAKDDENEDDDDVVSTVSSAAATLMSPVRSNV